MKLYVINGTTREGITGSDSNNGLTPSTPKATLANLLSTYTVDYRDTIYVDGIHVGTFTAAANVKRWGVGDQPWITAGQEATPLGTWTHDGVNTWRITIGTNKVLGYYDDDGGGGPNLARDHGNVCANWFARQDADGRHYGWYKTIQTRGGSRSTNTLSLDKSYDYDRSTGVLWIRDDTLLPAGTNPNTLTGMNAVRFVTEDDYLIGLDQRSANYVTCDGINFALFMTRKGSTYAYYGGGDCLVTRCKAYDSEVHNFVFSRNPNNNSVIEDSESWCTGSVTTDTNGIAWYNTGDVTGARARRLKVRCYVALDPDGAPFSSSLTNNGMYVHTDGAGGTVNDFYAEDVDVMYFGTGVTGNPGTPFSVGNTGAAPSAANQLKFDSYPIRLRRCACRRATDTLNFTGNMAFDQCFFDNALSAGRSSLAIPDTVCAINRDPGLGTAFKVLWQASVLVTNSDSGGVASRRIWFIRTGSAFLQINPTYIDQTTTGTAINHSYYQYEDPNPYVFGSAGFLNYARNPIVYWATQHSGNYLSYFDNDTPANPDNYDWDGSMIYNIGSGARFGEEDEWDTEAEWIVQIDTHAVIGVNPGFADATSYDPDVAGRPSANSEIWKRPYKPDVIAHVGYNQRRNSHNRGAWQRGPGRGHTGVRRIGRTGGRVPAHQGGGAAPDRWS